MWFAILLVAFLKIYAVVGLLFGVWFVCLGAGQLDASARGISIPTRLFLLPGSAALWPVLWQKWRKRHQPVHPQPQTP